MHDIYIYIRGEAHIQYSTYSFFSKTYLTKSVRNVEIAFLYIMKHVKILLGKVTTLHFMYDVYIYIYIYKGEAHIQLHVQLICTVPNIQMF
jgi:hypothetical protein